MAILSTDPEVRRLLDSTRSVAVVGMSPRPARHSHDVASWLIVNTTWTVWFVNPNESEILGRPCYASLADLPEPPDMVNVFRNRGELGSVADDAIAVGARSLWFQLDLVDHDAAGRASAAGLDVVQDMCLKVEVARAGRQLAG